MKITIMNVNIPEILAATTVKDRKESIKLQTLFGQFCVDDPSMYKFYSTYKNIDNKLNLPNGGFLL